MSEQNQQTLSPAESYRIHKEDNRVYFSPEVGFYTVKWIETGNNDIVLITPINITKHWF